MNLYFHADHLEEPLCLQFRNGDLTLGDHQLSLKDGEKQFIRMIQNHRPYFLVCALRGNSLFLSHNGITEEYEVLTEQERYRAIASGGNAADHLSLITQMPGKIVKIMVQEGQSIHAGDPLLVIEAMKMENELRATAPAVVDKIHVEENQAVEAKATLITFQEPE